MYENFPNSCTHLLAIYSIAKLPTTINQQSLQQPIAVIRIHMILYTYKYKHAINLYANICRYRRNTISRGDGCARIRARGYPSPPTAIHRDRPY